MKTTQNQTAAQPDVAHIKHLTKPQAIARAYDREQEAKREADGQLDPAIFRKQERDADQRTIALMREALGNALGSLEACEIILKPRTERARLSADIAFARAVLAKTAPEDKP